MKRFALMTASAAIGLAMLAGVTHQLTAEAGGGSGGGSGAPPVTGACYYSMYTCSYGESNAYWSDCSPIYSPGMLPTANAKAICATYHDS